MENTEKYEVFAREIGGITEQEMDAVLAAVPCAPMTDEEVEDMYQRDLYRDSVSMVNPHLAEAMG